MAVPGAKTKDSVGTDHPSVPSGRGLAVFRRRQDGATAVEFALVATPFFALLFAIMEVSLVFFASQVLDNGVSQTSRLIRTGQAESRGFDESSFRTELCSQINALFQCNERLSIDVQTFDNFGSVDLGAPFDGDELDTSGFGYNGGNGGDIVVVRVFYAWPTIVPRINLGDVPTSNGDRILGTTAVFRNEPF